MNKTTIITGITGASGPYLAQLLCEDKHNTIYCIVRENSQRNFDFLDEFNLRNNIHIINADITDKSNITNIISDIQPHEIYNLAAITNPGISFKQPELTLDVNGMAVLHMMDAIRTFSPTTKFCQVSTSEIFSGDSSLLKSETTPINPTSPYGASKAYAQNIVDIYRKAYGLFAVNMICFNHESPRRSNGAVTKKIVDFAKQYSKNRNGICKLGNLNISRDWGDARSFVEGMYLAMQQDKYEDFVLGTGITYTLRDFCIKTFQQIGIDGFHFVEDGINEKGIDAKGNILVEVDPTYYRPNDPITKYAADATKAYNILGWRNRLSLDQTIEWMLTNVYPTN